METHEANDQDAFKIGPIDVSEHELLIIARGIALRGYAKWCLAASSLVIIISLALHGYETAMNDLRIAVIVMTGIAVSFLLNFKKRVAVAYAASDGAFLGMTWRAHRKGLELEGKTYQVTYPWSLNLRTIATKNALILVGRDRNLPFIPLRAFASGDDAKVAMAWMNEKMKRAG